MVDFCDTNFSVSLQAEMLNLNRSSLYYKHRPSTEWDLQLNRLIDITHMKHPGNPIYPYLLGGVSASFPYHIWSIDITYIPIQKSWLYLVAIIDWYSRYVLA